MQAEECWHRSLTPLMEVVRARAGTGPVYLSFDIDGLDPAFAPGTGTPEIGGLTIAQGIEIIRGCQGLDLIGCDLVEVLPLRMIRLERHRWSRPTFCSKCYACCRGAAHGLM